MSGERVFVSSTWIDNRERRQWVEDAILDADMVPVGMERFSASTRPTVEECLRLVREADLLVGIVAHRYGWIPPGEERSITELEYDAASERLMFLIDPDLPVQRERDFDEGNDRWDKQAKLDAFKKRVSVDQMPALFQEESLGRKVLRALEDWRDRRSPTRPEGPDPPPPDPDAEIRRYCERAAGRHEFLRVAGFQTKLRVPIRLEELYVPLHAAADLRGLGEAAFADAADAERKLAHTEESLDLPATEAFAAAEERGRSGLVLLGDPGSGKTTHLKRVLLWVLQKGPESLGLPRGMLPVFLPLRELRDLESGLEVFIESQLDHRHLRMPEGFGRRLLERGNLLLLLDGLDEVADAEERQRVVAWIDEAASDYPDCRLLVSCRFAGYGVQTTQGEGRTRVRLSERFLELHLRPLSTRQAEAFVHNWYRIVEAGLAKDSEHAEELARTRAGALVKALREPDFRARRVFELTRNPLLLTNLCLVHRDRGQLPRRRSTLYGECIDVLLERWSVGKGLPAAVTAQDGRRVLQPVALWLHEEEGRTRAGTAELAPVIEPSLEAIRWKGGTAKQFLRRIRDRSGLLTGWDQDQFGFMHLGFQEYLAAREIRRLAFQDPSALRELASHHGDSWWQEVALLLVALEDPSLFEPYLREVLEQPAFVERPEAIDALIEDAAEVSTRPLVELLERPPGADRVLWSRQLAALRVLKRLSAEELDSLGSRLREHPSSEIRAWWAERRGAPEAGVGTANGIELVPVPAGHFEMGSPPNEEERYSDEGPQHRVDVEAFEIGRYPVTNEEYGRFLEAQPDVGEPMFWGDRNLNQARQPVMGVSWHDARRFAEWVGCRLPSEAEWEYAARAGSRAPYLTGVGVEDLDRHAWYSENSGGRVHPVGEKEPNAWGLYDVLGNVLEWVEDDWHGDYEDAPEDGSPWVNEPRAGSRVLRGGAFLNGRRNLRVAYRNYYAPESQVGSIGFRVVRSRSGGQSDRISEGRAGRGPDAIG